MDRRDYLKGLAGAAVAGTAGCLGENSGREIELETSLSVELEYDEGNVEFYMEGADPSGAALAITDVEDGETYTETVLEGESYSVDELTGDEGLDHVDDFEVTAVNAESSWAGDVSSIWLRFDEEVQY